MDNDTPDFSRASIATWHNTNDSTMHHEHEKKYSPSKEEESQCNADN
jgi:hypothetical protein